MEIERIHHCFSVCKVKDYSCVDLRSEYCFIGKTDQENSLVCLTEYVPENVIAREDGWRVFRVRGMLDFSLIGILAKLAALLAEHEISIFAVSTDVYKRQIYGRIQDWNSKRSQIYAF